MSTQSAEFVILSRGEFGALFALNLGLCHFRVLFVSVCSIRFCFRTEEEKREAARRLEEWREEKRRNEEREKEQRLCEEIQRRRREKVLFFCTNLAIAVVIYHQRSCLCIVLHLSSVCVYEYRVIYFVYLFCLFYFLHFTNQNGFCPSGRASSPAGGEAHR